MFLDGLFWSKKDVISSLKMKKRRNSCVSKLRGNRANCTYFHLEQVNSSFIDDEPHRTLQ